MPLPPSGKTAWPPVHCDVPFADMDAWHAWYAGDLDHLAVVYGGEMSVAQNLKGRSFFDLDSLARRGGLLGKAARMFVGQPVAPGQQRAKLHIPLAGDMSELSANLLFADIPTVTASIEGEDEAGAATATTDRLRQYLDDAGHAALREAAELGSALGGVYLRVVWDREIGDRPWLDVVYPDAAVPEWRWNRLRAVTFWRELDPLADENERWRLLERHEKGIIQYALYKGKGDEIGMMMPLADHPDAADLAGRINEADGVTQRLPVDRMLAVYVPNNKPNRLWRGVSEAAALGRSDYAGVEPVMDALDEAWTSWMRDLRLGKARLLVPQSMLETDGRGQGALLDIDREVMVGLEGILGEGGDAITESQFAIRVEEHERTTNRLTEQVLRSAGYSSQSYGMDGQVAVTATEVAARKELSLTTRGQKILYWRPALRDILGAWLDLDRAEFGARVDPDAELSVSWPQAVKPDMEATARTLTLLESAGAVSRYMKVKILHPEWDEVQVQEEMQRIRDDKLAAPPVQARGGFGKPGEDGEGSEGESDTEEEEGDEPEDGEGREEKSGGKERAGGGRGKTAA